MKKHIIYSFVALLMIVAVGCDDYLDVNTNPNAPTVTIPGLVLSGALVETARIQNVEYTNYTTHWVGYWSASGTYSSSGDVRRFFNISNASFQTVWTSNYLNANNYLFVENNAIESGADYDYYQAMAKIMKVWNFEGLIDNYGNIPYFTALKGFAVLSPSYDDASAAYDDMVNQLDDAVALIQNAPATVVAIQPTIDIMFGGNMTNWVKLANTMKLRLLLKQSEVTAKAAAITAEVAEITANGGGYLDVDAMIQPGYAKATGNQNPLWETIGLGTGNEIGNRDYHRSSEYGVDFFENNGDPRVDAIFRNVGDLPGTSTGTNYVGIPFGADPDAPYTTNNTSGAGLGVLPGPTAPVVFLSAAQSYLLQAEAALLGWTAGDAETLYRSGVQASFDLLDAGDATTYLNSGGANVDYTTATTDEERLETIIVQRWAANYSIDPMQAWNDLRRTGYPDDLPESLAAAKINPTPPIRLLYPQTEYSNNAGAVEQATSAQGLVGNYQFDKPVFWDVD